MSGRRPQTASQIFRKSAAAESVGTAAFCNKISHKQKYVGATSYGAEGTTVDVSSSKFQPLRIADSVAGDEATFGVFGSPSRKLGRLGNTADLQNLHVLV